MYAKLNNGQIEKYPYTIGMLRKDNPNTSFPKVLTDETLESFGLVRVTKTPRPEDDDSKNFSLTVEQVSGSWVEKWIATNATQQQIAERSELRAQLVRSQRDELLSGSDWTQLADAPVDQTAWETYRQALRDLPSQEGFPYSVIWPIKPE